MLLTSLTEIESVIRASWSEQTCDPVDLPEWSPENPGRGQCGVTALVLQDLLGGELLVAEVRNDDGSRQGVHYWNRLAGGIEIDLTRAQFTSTEVVQAPTVVAREPDVSGARLAQQHRSLAARVRDALAERVLG